MRLVLITGLVLVGWAFLVYFSRWRRRRQVDPPLTPRWRADNAYDRDGDREFK